MKRKFKLIVPSFVAIIFCLLLIAGSTFALFTSEASASISVTSGKVDLDATLSNMQAFSAEAVDAYQSGDLDAGTAEAFGVSSKYKYVAKEASNEAATLYSFTTGGTAELTTNKTLVLNKVVPGDRVTLNLHLHNDSNVAIKYRVRVNAFEDNGLYEALDINVGGKKLNGIIRVDAWTEWLPTESTDKDILLEVVLPITAGNEYQNKTAKLRFTVEAVQGNAKTDDLLDQVNAYLDTASGTNKTMQDAIDEIKAAATTENKFANFVATNYLWNKDTDQFYSESTIVSGFGEGRFFKAYTYDQFDALTNPTFGIYAYSTSTSTAWPTSLTINHSFDQGEEAITTINYTRNQASDEAKEVSIRTNSLATNLNVDAPKDVVHHYGDAGILTIIAVAGQSYHEFGTVGFLDIAKGRVALEPESSVTQVHITKKANEEKFDEIIVSIAPSVEKPTFSRDDVEIASQGTLVVALQQGTEDVTEETELDYVWLTKQGIYEQIKVSDNSESAGNVWVDQLTASTTEEQAKVAKTQAAANEIANNIQRNGSQKVEATVQVDATSYTVTLNEETRELVVAETAAPQAEVEAQTQAQAKEEAIQATGVKASEKAEIVNNVVEETITEEAIKEDNDYVARIGTTYYKSFDAAFAGAINNSVIRIIRSCDAAADSYDLTGKNLTIYVEEKYEETPIVLNFGGTQNYQITIGWNNGAGSLTLAGPGKITFKGNSNYGLINQTGKNDNVYVKVKDVTIEATGSAGHIYEGPNLIIESGYFKNIVMHGSNDPKISGGFFTSNVESYLVEGKMLAASALQGYNYVVAELDPAHAKYQLKHNNEFTYYSTLNTASAQAVSGDILTFLTDVTLDQNNNKFWDKNGVTYDLNDHTITGSSGYPIELFDLKNGESLTIKNGTINVPVDYFCGVNDFSINTDNILFADVLFSEAIEYVNGIYVKEQANYFTFKAEAPSTYVAKIERGTTNLYFNYEGGVAYALSKAQNEDHIYVNAYESDAQAMISEIDQIITITKTYEGEFPTVIGAGVEVEDKVIDENTKEYKGVKAAVCKVNGYSCDSLEEGFCKMADNSLGSSRTLVLYSDCVVKGKKITSSTFTTVNALSNAPDGYGIFVDAAWNTSGVKYTIDFNGHKIYALEDTYQYVVMISKVTNSVTINLIDSKSDGGIVDTYDEKYSQWYDHYLIGISGTGATLNISSGKYTSNRATKLLYRSNATVNVNGGSFSMNPTSFANNYYVPNIDGTFAYNSQSGCYEKQQ